jgi:signal transduction histidine kinase
MVEAARDESERLLRILNDLLDLARLEQGNSDLFRERTAPVELVQRAGELMRDAFKVKGLTWFCELDPELPPVLVDRQRINHVFTNLITNAIKYSPAGGEIVIRAARSADGGVEFTVRDSGQGIPLEFQDRIFDRFFRVPGQTKTGAGLGLSIAREIVVAHGGRIGVRSQTDRGSEFYFILAGAEEAPASSPERVGREVNDATVGVDRFS